jgi:hypothetical protein
MVSSKWIFKIKHVADGNIMKFKVGLWREGSLKRGIGLQ